MRNWLCAVSFKHFEDLFGVHVLALAAFAQEARLEYGFLSFLEPCGAPRRGTPS